MYCVLKRKKSRTGGEKWHPEKKGAETYYKEYERKKTLYVLHGGSDDASLYLRRTRLEEYALERDLAVVMPEVRNSFYCDMVHGKKYFTYLSEELPEIVENIFPLTHDPKERYVIGNSMGSHGTGFLCSGSWNERCGRGGEPWIF